MKRHRGCRIGGSFGAGEIATPSSQLRYSEDQSRDVESEYSVWKMPKVALEASALRFFLPLVVDTCSQAIPVSRGSCWKSAVWPKGLSFVIAPLLIYVFALLIMHQFHSSHRTDTTINKAKTYINKGAITKERPFGQTAITNYREKSGSKRALKKAKTKEPTGLP